MNVLQIGSELCLGFSPALRGLTPAPQASQAGRHLHAVPPPFLTSPPRLTPETAAIALTEEKELRGYVSRRPLPAVPRSPLLPQAGSFACACVPSFHPARRQIEKDLLARTPKHLLVEGKCALGGILQQLSAAALEAASVSFSGCGGRGGQVTLAHLPMWG